jgi:CelD/BcsL family acetyltransferase involved in cellulose biosynthesis
MPDWLELERQVPSSFFQSWAWIGTWLHCQPPGTAIKCVRAFKQDRPVAIGLLGSQLTTRHKVICSRQWCVSETGDPLRDGLTIEHNGFLIEHLASDEVLRAIFNALRSRGTDWDELVVSGIDAGEAQRYSRVSESIGLRVLTRWSKPYFFVAAEDLTANGGDYLASLSSNTRYQIRRAMREYERSGPLAVTRAQSLDQAMAYFDELTQLHQAYWNARGHPGAFASEFARRFHRTLIQTWLPSGSIQLLRVAAGTNLIGYLYNFEHRGVISSYQSGFRYSDNPKLKPGLVSHALAIQTSLSAGASSYDLLMGRQQYKEMLATRRGDMSWLVIQQPRVRFALESRARAFVSTLRALQAKATRRIGPGPHPSAPQTDRHP